MFVPPILPGKWMKLGGFVSEPVQNLCKSRKVVQILGKNHQKPAEPALELSAPLRRPAFRRLASSFAINELGDWLGLIALAVLVFDRTNSALATTGLFLGTRFLPALLAPAFVARI